MCVLHVAAGLNTGGLPDFWRDMYWATSIAYGERFPLSGPPIDQFMELGPWWFYLLAAPVWLTHRIAFASAFLQLLASAKYFLAWRLGTRAVDARFGTIYAVCTAVAGWSTASFWFPSHPAVVETTLLLLAWATWRCWTRLSLGNAVVYGLAAAACFHAHPTTATYIVASGIALLCRHCSWRAFALLGVSASIVLLSLLPPWLDPTPAIIGGPKAFSSYATNEWAVDFFSRVLPSLRGVFVNGAWMSFLVMTKWNAAGVHFAWWLYCACLAFAGAGVLLLKPDQRHLRFWFAGGLCFVVVQIVFLTLIRNFTSIWMVISCLPPVSVSLAIGWYGWFGSGSVSRRRFAAGLLIVYAVLVVAPFGLFLRNIQVMRLMDANPLFNISDVGETYKTAPVPFVNVRDMERFAGELCAPVTLHARLGAAVENAYAVPERNACGRWPDLYFSGADNPGVHLAGIPARAVAAIGLPPDRTIGHMAMYSRVQAIAPAEGTRATALERMQVSPSWAPGPPTANLYEFESGAADVAVFTARATFSAMRIDGVAAADRPAKLLFTDGKMFAYGCAGCAEAERVHWRAQLFGVARNFDVIVLRSTSGGSVSR